MLRLNRQSVPLERGAAMEEVTRGNASDGEPGWGKKGKEKLFFSFIPGSKYVP